MLKPSEADAEQTAGWIASGRAGSNRSTGGRRGGEAGGGCINDEPPCQSADGAKGEQLGEVNGTLGEERNPKTAGCYLG